MAGAFVRTATEADMAAVLSLIRQLAEFERQPTAVSNTREGLMRDGFGAAPLFECLVAEKDGVILGFALFYPTYSTWSGPCLYLEDLFVIDSHRRFGIGSLLFEAVLDIARKRKVKRFSWQVLAWNEPAIGFYKKYGTLLDSEWINCKIIP